MINVLLLVVCAVVSYFIGNINWAITISKLRKKDIRDVGSGNPGTLNMGRTFGLKIGILTFLLDVMKGVLPVLATYFILRGRGYFDNTEFKVVDMGIYASGLCAVLGHIYPVFFKFKGGKGIASTIGVLIVCNSVQGWQWALVSVMAIVAAIIFILLTEFGAMGSFIAITPPVIGSGVYLFLSYAQYATQ
ncbi:MAG: glycerol-3-phosphate acyltransferase, partial [Clostridia bacterium]|nr:glycerol-3-phosphate acyltransferase [Clostridia bacterium]